MDVSTLVLTGPRGAGKTTLAKYLQDTGDFRLVGAVTTRHPRRDDAPRAYDYLTPGEFLAEAAQESFAVQSEYGPHLYAIRYSDIELVLSSRVSPILTLTPESARRYLSLATERPSVGVFLDAPDLILDDRLTLRDGVLSTSRMAQRLADREHDRSPLTHVSSTFTVNDLAARVAELLGQRR